MGLGLGLGLGAASDIRSGSAFMNFLFSVGFCNKSFTDVLYVFICLYRCLYVCICFL